MVQKLNTTPSFPYPPSPDGIMGWASGLVQAIVRELSYIGNRSNSLLAADGTEAATKPVLLASYTVATVPDASIYAGGVIYVSDGTSHKRLAISDGTDWRWPDGNIVS